MDYGKLLTRSFEITRKYRALWLFGFLLALFGGSGANFANAANFANGSNRNFGTTFNYPILPPGSEQMIAAIACAILCIVVVLFVLSIVVRITSRGALIGLVNELETSQTTPTVRHGFSIGRERFGSLLGVALIVNIPLFLITVIGIAVVALPFIASVVALTGTRQSSSPVVGPAVASILGSVALLCCIGVFLFILYLVIEPLYEFFLRTCVIGKRGAMDAIREGYRLARSHVGDVIVLYVLLFVIRIGYGIVAAIIGAILLGSVAAIAFLVGTLANSIGAGVVTAVVAGLPVVLVLLVIAAIYETFQSAMWTEGYLAVAGTAPAPAPAPAPVQAPAD